uniref:Toxin candidate TRINITY_DN91651_c0_g1_i1 n=1 Tax=Pachycerianthus maua TaxID=2736681 RepID=A0A7G7WZ26_9CNID|nr:toxin candidate TRINITY_DN91651_c0_g1_i1 [Pachycerianthus maua]
MASTSINNIVFAVIFLVLTTNCVNSAPAVSECAVQQNGCSIPLKLPFFYKKSFTPACERHDICYSCGQLYGWSRNDCDVGFKNYMYSVCDTKTKRFIDDLVDWINGWKDPVTRCKRVADIYYISVDTFAKCNYEKVSPDWCKKPCAKQFGDPTVEM